MASFKVTLDATLLTVMTDYTSKILDDAIHRIADKYGFDPEEAKQFLQSGGVVVKYPPLEREKLPWTGNVREECCKAIKKNAGLFTQCNGSLHDGDWCKPCSKEVAKKGKPSCGTVEERSAVDVLEYQVGPFKVKPYADYMKKHGIVREQVDKACEDYGITIDPRQFELKKRPRKPRNMASSINVDAPEIEEEDAMTAATGADPDEQLESDEEDEYEPPLPEAEPRVTTPNVPTAPVELAEEPTVTVLPAVEVTRATAPASAINAEQISTMDKKTVSAHCRARGIDIEGKGVVQLKRELTSSLK